MSVLNSDPIISARGISVSFKKGRALFNAPQFNVFHDLSFDIHKGDSLGIIGRNGAGKSTLLKVIAGILAPDCGEIEFRCRNIALLALGAGFNPNLSGVANILINGLFLGFRRSEIEAKTGEIVAYSGLGDAINDEVKTYSTGMRSRLAFSIAINLQPEVLLIDEALGVGDAQFMKKSTKTIHERILSDQTVVLVSHQADTIRSVCNKALWIEDGILKRYGEAAEVVDEYEKYIVS